MLAGVAALSLRAIDRLVSANRDIVTRTVPALRLTATAREAIEPLMRLEARAVAIGDPHYTTAWTERAAQVADDLERLGEYAQSSAERLYLREASAAFDGYRRVVAQERALVQMGDRRGAVRLTDVEARVLAERVEERLGALMSATHTRVLAVEADAARVESRMWTSVFCALGAAVGPGADRRRIPGAPDDAIAQRAVRARRRRSASGKFREPIAIKSRDEIGSLARVVQLDGRSAAPGRGNATGFLRDRLARAPRRPSRRSAAPPSCFARAFPGRSTTSRSGSPTSSRSAPGACCGS